MKLTDIIDEAMMEHGATESEISIAKAFALSINCPNQASRDNINREIPPEAVEIVKEFVRFTFLRAATDPEFRKQLREEIAKEVKNN
jgi:hypothetical protein